MTTPIEKGDSTNALRVKPQTLYVDREDGAALYLEQLEITPEKWLRKHGVRPMYDSDPVVVMLDNSESRATHGEYCDTVALHGGEDAPLVRIEQAIAALQMAHAALLAAGQVDFIPKAER